MICIVLPIIFLTSCSQILPVSYLTENATVSYLPENKKADDYCYESSLNSTVPLFSFCYPSNYHLIDEARSNLNPWLHIGLNSNTKEEFFAGIVKDIDIYITNYDSRWLNFPNAESLMNEKLSECQDDFHINPELLAKRRFTLDGIEGWEIIISFQEAPLTNKVDMIARPAALVIKRSLYFDYQGITWELTLYTDKESYYMQTKQDFEHILQTFRFNEEPK
jgi:hypothetical protein